MNSHVNSNKQESSMPENISFQNRKGKTLAGVIHKPRTGPVIASALFAHCFTCTKNSKAAVRIAEALADEGIRVLRFDFTGLGQSEGDFSDTGFSSNVDDLIDAANFLEARGEAPELLVGHSLGGTAVLAAAHEIDSALAVATIAAPADANHILHVIGDGLADMETDGHAMVQLGGRPFKIKQDFVDDVRTQSVSENIHSLRKALLVMHSPVDTVVSIDQASIIFKNAKHPKSFVSLDNADHLLSRDQDSLYTAKVLATWASRFVAREEKMLAPARFVEAASVARGDKADGFLVGINSNGHRFIGDEPESYGGTNLGPTPYDMLGSALASCTTMTLNFFARRENLPLKSVETIVKHDQIHAKDCADCKKQGGKIDRFTRTIELQGELDAEQRALLLKIADRCPVHKTLENEIQIVSELS